MCTASFRLPLTKGMPEDFDRRRKKHHKLNLSDVPVLGKEEGFVA